MRYDGSYLATEVDESWSKYCNEVIPRELCTAIHPSDKMSILTLSDTNTPERSFAHYMAKHYCSMHSRAALIGALRPTSPTASVDSADSSESKQCVRFIQTSIEPDAEFSQEAKQDDEPDEPIVYYHQDDNTHASDIKTYSIDGAGFDVIIGIKLLCYCGTDSMSEPACGGIEHSAEAIKNFFITKILANFKDDRSVAYISGGALARDDHLRREMLGSLPFECALAASLYPDIRATLHADADRFIAKQKAVYMDGLDCVRRGISLFNESKEAEGFKADLTMNTNDHEAFEIKGYTISVSKPAT